MLQNTAKDMALKISQLGHYTDQQQAASHDVIDKVQDDASVRSRSIRSIPGMIDTNRTPSTTDSSKLLTTQALIVSLTSRLDEAEKNHYVPRRRQPGPGRGGGHPGLAGTSGNGGD